MVIHELKIKPVYYNAILSGEKKFEVRNDDRHFEVGDSIKLNEYDEDTYTGRSSLYNITYKLDGGRYGIEKGYCVLSISPYEEINNFADYLIENASEAFYYQDRELLEKVLRDYRRF